MINNIPKFTKNDFLKTHKPYKFIAENSTNDFEEKQLIELVRENALRVGVANFNSMYKSYSFVFKH